MNVLIVDDDTLVAQSLQAILEASGEVGNSMDFVLSAMCKMGKKRWSFWKIIRWIWSLQILICRR